MGRRRRPAAQTRAEILAIAQDQLRRGGPASIRLDDVAAQIGISRQAILHHFGSREGLMRAVVEGAWTDLFRDLASLAADPSLGADGFVDLVDDVVRERGNARLGAWLLLSEQGLPESIFQGALADLPDALLPDAPGDARQRVLLLGAALFGDALFGERLRQALGIGDDEAQRLAFRRWLAQLLFVGADGGAP